MKAKDGSFLKRVVGVALIRSMALTTMTFEKLTDEEIERAGIPGVAKSEIIKKAFKEKGFEVHSLKAVSLSDEELGKLIHGYPILADDNSIVIMRENEYEEGERDPARPGCPQCN